MPLRVHIVGLPWEVYGEMEDFVEPQTRRYGLLNRILIIYIYIHQIQRSIRSYCLRGKMERAAAV